MDLKIKDIKLDDENPRSISDEAKLKLQESIKEFSDLSSIVFNKTTNTLVSGHQRLKALQELYPNLQTEKTDDPNILNLVFLNDSNVKINTGFKIRIVEWSKEKQKAGNIIANDERISGDWHHDKLANIFETYDLEEFNTRFELPEILNSIDFTDESSNSTSNDSSKQPDDPNIKTIIIKCSAEQLKSLLKELDILNKDKFNNNIFINHKT